MLSVHILQKMKATRNIRVRGQNALLVVLTDVMYAEKSILLYQQGRGIVLTIVKK